MTTNFERRDGEEAPLTERVVRISRVAKVVKGGRHLSFNAVVVMGDGEGRVGIGIGKADAVPEGVRDNSKVVLRFVLDASGAATRIDFVGDAPPVLGNSAVAALRAASPFPPMDDNVRCLSGKKLNAIFSVPTL